jgi:hypothetical protein
MRGVSYMDYIFDKSLTQQAEETYEFMKDHIEKWGFVTLAQVDNFIGSYRLCHAYGFTNDIGWTSMDGIEFGWRKHEIVYTNRIGGAFHTGRYYNAMTLTMPEPKEITY